MQSNLNPLFVVFNPTENESYYICFLFKNDVQKAKHLLDNYLDKNQTSNYYKKQDFSKLEFVKTLVDDIFKSQDDDYNNNISKISKTKEELKKKEIFPISSIINIGNMIKNEDNEENEENGNNQNLKYINKKKANYAVNFDNIKNVDDQFSYLYMRQPRITDVFF